MRIIARRTKISVTFGHAAGGFCTACPANAGDSRYQQVEEKDSDTENDR
jgi:hypothetical protein